MTSTRRRFETRPEARTPDAERESRIDAVFDALASPGCRALLGRLDDAGEPVAVTALADRQAADEAGRDAADEAGRDAADEAGRDAADPDDRSMPGSVDRSMPESADARRARLHHTYLPKLDDAGLVEYDADAGLVRSWSTAAAGTLRGTVRDAADADLPVAVDALFDLLSDARRRRAFRVLAGHGELPLPDLADEVAVAERGRPLSAVAPDDVLGVYLSLYHTHVPNLADAGVAVYDQERDFVAVTDAGEAVASAVGDLCEAAAP